MPAGGEWSTSEPSFDEKRDRHVAELKAAGDQGRREGLLAQRRKLADGIPATAASPTRAECEQRWTDAGRKERTVGARDVFVGACASFPLPGLPGHPAAVAEAETVTP
ncbi:hypothetical protein Snoj_32340 [Streptomyces nojiriensis]|uniref:Uncharacterized protein n=1 Tax=Streptomyces nojiriensis TaxID=66374 RepID=A0ABQ3SMG0_9ACTN|nr:hypothetical protein [Streptomyces nojiriensis]QTI42889.1 hypothetical protein JYK04_00650 [Streptomyces nojiriensis]GGS33482.1 hypothetical protein GCM10010205_74670 [Streptomyces nojiriensis]GHI69316.1 hypothetical protein Snoj_32340 [Streptomyces nojiriensis]